MRRALTGAKAHRRDQIHTERESGRSNPHSPLLSVAWCEFGRFEGATGSVGAPGSRSNPLSGPMRRIRPLDRLLPRDLRDPPRRPLAVWRDDVLLRLERNADRRNEIAARQPASLAVEREPGLGPMEG